MVSANLTTRPTAHFPSLRENPGRLLERAMHPSTFATRVPGDLWVPNLDFSETDQQFIVKLEVPGVTMDQVEIHLEGDLLTLRGERKQASEGKDERFMWQEREEGSFLRTMKMPSSVDPKGVVAVMEHGVLKVTVPKNTTATASPIQAK